MKQALFIKKFAFIIFSTFLTHEIISQELIVKSVGGNTLNFDEKIEYLDIEVAQLAAIVPNETKWWERLLGKKANFVLGYIEVRQGGETLKVPLFTYKKITDDNFDFKSIGVLENDLTFPIVRWAAYDQANPPEMKIVIKSWQEKDDVAAVEKIINGAAILSGIEASTMSKALDIGNTVMDLVNTIWPSKNKSNELSVSLHKNNLSKELIEIDYKGQNDTDPIVTLKLSKKNGRFLNRSFSDALNDFSTSEIEIWRKAILAADDNLKSTGINSVISQLDNFAEYVSGLELVYVDKVLLVAGAINNWAGNAYSGVEIQGKRIQLSAAQYRKLPGSDWAVVNRYSNYLDNMLGSNKCSTDACRSMASFLAKLSIGRIDDAGNYIGPTLTVTVEGTSNRINKKDFLESINIVSDAAFETKFIDEFNWSFTFKPGNLSITYDGNAYSSNGIEFKIVKVDDEYFIKSMSIS